MFKQTIPDTELTTEAANQFFSFIDIDSTFGDNVFGTALRILLYGRVPEGDMISFRFRSRTAPVESVGGILGHFPMNAGRLYVYHIGGSDEDVQKTMKLVVDGFTNKYIGYARVDKVSNFYRNSFPVVCFVNQELHSTVVFLPKATIQKVHYLCTAIPAMMPWYFSGDMKLKAEEIEFLKTFQEGTPDKFLQYVHKFATDADFETARLRSCLAGFETNFLNGAILEAKTELQDIDNTIESINLEFSRYLERRENTCIRLLGLERKKQEDGEPHEILDYFLTNKKLYLVETNDTEMTFCVKDYITYFDEDAATEYIKNHHGYFYKYCSNDGITIPEMEDILMKIFVDQEIRIRVCAAYRLRLNGSASGVSNFSFDSHFGTYIPNPHIQGYACLGNYRMEINNAMKKHDYIYALEQCIASAKSLNFHDSVVMDYFSEDLTKYAGTNRRCIELQDGTVVTLSEAIKWIRLQKAQGNKPEEDQI